MQNEYVFINIYVYYNVHHVIVFICRKTVQKAVTFTNIYAY